MKKLSVLIVEDELIIYMHITKTLKSLGFENIYVARTSKDALAIASNTKIDLLFSDIKIEGNIDGIDTASTLQALYSLPVIFITAYKDKEMLKRVSKIDTIGYLLKPYRVDELEALILLAIEKFSLIKQNNFQLYKEYSYCKEKQKLYKNEEEQALTKKEQLFISLLFCNLDSIIQYEVIDKTIWHDTHVSENARRTFIYRIKQKFPDMNLSIEKNLGIGLFN